MRRCLSVQTGTCLGPGWLSVDRKTVQLHPDFYFDHLLLDSLLDQGENICEETSDIGRREPITVTHSPGPPSPAICLCQQPKGISGLVHSLCVVRSGDLDATRPAHAIGRQAKCSPGVPRAALHNPFFRRGVNLPLDAGEGEGVKVSEPADQPASQPANFLFERGGPIFIFRTHAFHPRTWSMPVVPLPRNTYA